MGGEQVSSSFHIDDDEEYPTICGTGLEDYFCGGAVRLSNVPGAGYTTSSAPFCLRSAKC